jgi:hypothetical protein
VDLVSGASSGSHAAKVVAATAGTTVWRSVLPFAVALIFVVLGPLLDDLIWRDKYVSFYTEHPVAEVDAEDLANAAGWAVDLAQIVPGVFITITGILLLSAKVSTSLGVANELVGCGRMLGCGGVSRGHDR